MTYKLQLQSKFVHFFKFCYLSKKQILIGCLRLPTLFEIVINLLINLMHFKCPTFPTILNFRHIILRKPNNDFLPLGARVQ